MRMTLGASVDSQFIRNWRESRRVNIQWRGIYHYYATEVEPEAQAQMLLSAAAGDFGTEPITVDCERRDDERLKPFDRATYTANLRRFLDYLHARTPRGVRIYTSAVEWRAITTLPAWARDYALWVAAYPFDPNSATYRPDLPPGWDHWAMWQYISTGYVDGIAGPVDLNREKVRVQYIIALPDTLTTGEVLRRLTTAFGTDLLAPCVVVPFDMASQNPAPIFPPTEPIPHTLRDKTNQQVI